MRKDQSLWIEGQPTGRGSNGEESKTKKEPPSTVGRRNPLTVVIPALSTVAVIVVYTPVWAAASTLTVIGNIVAGTFHKTLQLSPETPDTEFFADIWKYLMASEDRQFAVVIGSLGLMLASYMGMWLGSARVDLVILLLSLGLFYASGRLLEVTKSHD